MPQNIQLVLGDCLQVLAAMPEGSVDAVVTDPPYALTDIVRPYQMSENGVSVHHDGAKRQVKRRNRGGFMGKEWDAELPGTEHWQAVLCVLKPGGYMLAFGGTRTYHRLACAVEDAGFEIRDCILGIQRIPSLAWVFGSGFPKGKGCLKPAWESIICAQKPLPFNEFVDSIVGNLLLLESQLCSLLPATTAESISKDTPAGRSGQRSSVRRSAATKPGLTSDLSALMGTSQFRSVVNICLNIVSSWKDTLAVAYELLSMSTTETATRLTIDWKTLSCCLLVLTPQNIIQAELKAPGSKLNALPAARYLNVACESINATRELSVLGNAISEGHISPLGEAAKGVQFKPILLCRKPGPKVLPLGIDECRVPTKDETKGGARKLWSHYRDGKEPSADRTYQDKGGTDFAAKPGPRGGSPAGRYPSNVTTDGSDEVMEAFAAFGESKSSAKGSPGGKRGSTTCYAQDAYTQTYERTTRPAHGDTGTAARFFYCAKASRSERETGLDGIEIVIIKFPTWENQDRKVLLRVDTEQLPPRVIAVSGAFNNDATAWNTWLFGSPITGRSLMGTKSITGTRTNSTTGSKTLMWLLRSHTNDFIVVANGEGVGGGNLAASAEHSGPSLTITNGLTVYPPGVENVVSIMPLTISGNAGSPASHPTVKPRKLMEWLVKLVCPKDGTVLDPFMGSGTTGVAVKRLGRSFIGIEKNEDYFKIAEKRVNKATCQETFGF